ncbi:hypothetical protein [Amycolatopsis sp. NPDC003731]
MAIEGGPDEVTITVADSGPGAHNNGGAVFTLTLPRRPETPTPAPDAL